MSKVAILGASDHPERYSYKAQNMLREYGHEPLPVSLRLDEVLGVPATHRLQDIPDRPIDTVTVYLSPAHQAGMVEDILAIQPRRVIFNPGSEDADNMARLSAAGVLVEEACTLVLLRTHQF